MWAKESGDPGPSHSRSGAGPCGHPALGGQEREQVVLPVLLCAQWLLGKSLGHGVAAGGLWSGSPAPTPAGRRPKPTSRPGRGADVDHLRARGCRGAIPTTLPFRSPVCPRTQMDLEETLDAVDQARESRCSSYGRLSAWPGAPGGWPGSLDPTGPN